MTPTSMSQTAPRSFPDGLPRPRHLHREIVTATLVDVDPLGASITVRLHGLDHRVPFRQPGSDWIGTLSPVYRSLRHLRKYLGRVVDAEITYHNLSGWTVFGRRALAIR
jgi:hypothetical protein